MEFQYPSFEVEAQFQGSTQTYYSFLVMARTGGAAHAAWIMLDAPEGVIHGGPPPAQASAAAALKLVSDMRSVLNDGVEKHVQDIMRQERRFTKQDEEEKVQIAESAFNFAEHVGAEELAEAQADLEKLVRTKPVGKKRRTMMGAADGPRTVGAQELIRDGFTVLKEVSLVGKGPGQWYEVLEPPSLAPKEWNPRAKHKRPKDQLLMLRQKNGAWHAFYQFAGTGSGSTPRAALTGGLGDVMDTDSQIRGYCDLVLAAPRRLAQAYEGLYAAQGSCFAERSERG